MVDRIIETTPGVDPFKTISVEEYRKRRRRVHDARQDEALDGGFVFSDDHFRVHSLVSNINELNGGYRKQFENTRC
jgi:hypothetical protein